MYRSRVAVIGQGHEHALANNRIRKTHDLVELLPLFVTDSLKLALGQLGGLLG